MVNILNTERLTKNVLLNTNTYFFLKIGGYIKHSVLVSLNMHELAPCVSVGDTLLGDFDLPR